jgi:Amylo-alpha-1,6-glucosidase
LGSRALVDDTYQRALEVLRRNVAPRGLKASQAYYNQVWARDAFISFIGGNVANDPALLQAAGATIETFTKTRAPLGQIANFYDLTSGKPEFGWSGSTDSSCWYIIGLASLYAVTNDKALLGPPLDAAIDAYRFVRYQDANNSWLVDSPQGADWMDAAIQRTGKTLYNNVLFLTATKCLSSILSSSGRSPGSEGLLDRQELKERFTDVFLPGPNSAGRISKYWPRLADHYRASRPFETPLKYYLQYISFARIDSHFDTLSNLLCGLLEVADGGTFHSILDVIETRRLSHPYPVRVLDPPYRKGDPGYDDAFDSALPVQHRSEPMSYHNGAVWPFVGGFYVCALSSLADEGASRELEALARANSVFREEESVGFNEWLDGSGGVAKGQYGQSWNAGMFIAAYSATRGQDPFGFLRRIAPEED